MMSFLVPTMIGAKTMMVVAVPAMTAVPTSLTPLRVALKGLALSISRCLKILSVTTTALSTSMPIASIRPIIDNMFRESPAKYSAPSVISSENGTDEMTINVVETWRRNRYRTMIASRPPSRPAFIRSDRDLRTLSPALSSGNILMPLICGKLATSSTSAITRSVTSTRFVPVVLFTATPMAYLRSRCRP